MRNPIEVFKSKNRTTKVVIAVAVVLAVVLLFVRCT